MQDFKVLSPDAFDASEEHDAAAYWSEVDIGFYRPIRPWTRQLAELVAERQVASVFEFGCNAAKNLKHIRDVIPGVEAFGIDVNLAAIHAARSDKCTVALGDQNILPYLEDGRFDLSFTVSVLDHVPDPQQVLKELLRISRKAVILCEPWLGQEGRVLKNTHRTTGELIDTTPYSYSWNYTEMLTELDVSFSTKPVNMETNLGRYYKFYCIDL